MKVILFFASILFPLSLQAQTLSGKIVNEQKQPVAFANLILLSIDSTFIAGNVSDENGMFRLELPQNASLLKVSYIGYPDQILPISSGTDKSIIQMKEETTALNEVIVKGNLPVTRIKGDAMVTTVENSVLSKLGSANDVLAKVPGIIKQDEAIEVFGKGEPLIYINGRQVRNKQELEQLSSDEIKDIELITNPGSRYDATVKAIIRIQTARRRGKGFGFDVRSSYCQSQNTDLIEQLSFNDRHANLDLFGSAYYMHSNTMTKAAMEQENRVDGDGIWNQNNSISSGRRFNYLNMTAGFNYGIAENHSLGMQYDITAYPSYFDKSDVNSTVLRNGEFYDYLKSYEFIKHDYKPQHLLNAYYNGKLDNLSIDLNVDYFREKYELESATTENSREQENRQIHSLNPVDNQLAAAKLVLTCPLLGGELSWGGEYAYTLRTDDYLSFSSDYIPTSYSKIREHNGAAFAEYKRVFPFGRLTAGVRYEHVKFNYYQNQEYQGVQSRKYDNVYPNVSFGTQAGKVHLQLSYTAKTQRPAYWQLSNNLIYINRFTWKKGEPALIPALTHDVTLTGTWRFLQAVLSFQQQRDAIIQWSSSVAESPEIVLMQPVNFGKLPLLTAMVAASPTIGCWSPSWILGVKKQWVTVESSNYSVRMNDPMLTAAFNNILSFPAGFAFGVDFSFQGKGYYQNIYLNRNIWLCNLSLRKSFLNDAVSLELRGNDLFYKRRNSVVVYYNHLIASQTDRMDSREFVFTIRYKFNHAPNKYKGTGAGNEQRSRF